MTYDEAFKTANEFLDNNYQWVEKGGIWRSGISSVRFLHDYKYGDEGMIVTALQGERAIFEVRINLSRAHQCRIRAIISFAIQEGLRIYA